MSQYKEVFDMFDLDHNGAISRGEFDNAFKRFSMREDHAELMKLITSVDADGDGELEWDEFINLMNEGFETADTDSDGLLSAEDLLRYMTEELGEEITLEDAETMMITADVQHRGKIDYQEFREMLLYAA